MEGESTERLVTRADVDRFDSEFQAEASKPGKRVAAPEPKLITKSSSTVSVKKQKSEDLDPNKVITILSQATGAI